MCEAVKFALLRRSCHDRMAGYRPYPYGAHTWSDSNETFPMDVAHDGSLLAAMYSSMSSPGVTCLSSDTTLAQAKIPKDGILEVIYVPTREETVERYGRV
jgi:hypothetical protein